MRNLIENKFIDYLADKNLGYDIVKVLQNVCLKLIEKKSKEGIEDLQNNPEYFQDSTQKYFKLEKLRISCEKIFYSQKYKF